MIDRSAHIRAAALTFRTDDVYHTLEEDDEDYENRALVEALEEELDMEYLLADPSNVGEESGAAGGPGEAAAEQTSSEVHDKEAAGPSDAGAAQLAPAKAESSSAFAPIGSSRGEASLGSLAASSSTHSAPTASPLPHSANDEDAEESSSSRREGVKGKSRSRELQQLLPDVKTGKKKWVGAINARHEELLSALDVVLTDLKSDPDHSEPFMAKVKKASAPDYYELITKPMYFGLMSQKLKKCAYTSKSEFEMDLDLIWSNCEKYNPEDSPLVRSSNILKERSVALLATVPDIDAKAYPHSAEAAAAATARLAAGPSPTPSSPPLGGAPGRDVSPFPGHGNAAPASEAGGPGAGPRAGAGPRERAPARGPSRPLDCLCATLGCCRGERRGAGAGPADAELDELKRDRWRLVTFRQRVRRREYLEAQLSKRFGEREAIPRASDRMQRFAEGAERWGPDRVEKALLEAAEARRAAARAAAAARAEKEAKEKEAAQPAPAPAAAPTPMEVDAGAGAPAEAAKGDQALQAPAPSPPTEPPKSDAGDSSAPPPRPRRAGGPGAPAGGPDADSGAGASEAAGAAARGAGPTAVENALVSSVRPGVVGPRGAAPAPSSPSPGCFGFYPELGGHADGVPDSRAYPGLVPRLPPPPEAVIPRTERPYEPLFRPNAVLSNLEAAARIREHSHVLALTSLAPDEERPPPPTRPDVARLVAASRRVPPAAPPALGEAPPAMEAVGAYAMMRQVVALMLSHAGFDGASEHALSTLTDVAAGYMSRLGRSMRMYRDAYHATATPLETVEAALSAVSGGDATRMGADVPSPVECLHLYVKERLEPQAARLAEAAEADEEAVALMTGSFGSGEQSLELDFLGLSELGVPKVPPSSCGGPSPPAPPQGQVPPVSPSAPAAHPPPAPAASAPAAAVAPAAPPPPPPPLPPGRLLVGRSAGRRGGPHHAAGAGRRGAGRRPGGHPPAPAPAASRPGPPPGSHHAASPDASRRPAAGRTDAGSTTTRPPSRTPRRRPRPRPPPPRARRADRHAGAGAGPATTPVAAAPAHAHGHAAAGGGAAHGHGKRKRGEEAETPAPAIVVHETGEGGEHDGPDGGDGASSIASRSAPGSPSHEGGSGDGDHHELSVPHGAEGRQRRSSRQRKPRGSVGDDEELSMQDATPGSMPGKRKRGRPPGAKRDS
eukprot:tig00001331_g8177.t1